MTKGFDTINYWSEIKLDIIREYAGAYSKIMAARKDPSLYHLYIDAFAGAGKHISRDTGEFVAGSPLNALKVRPPFREYHFIDLDRDKAASLRSLTAGRADVSVHEGDCNVVLLEDVFPLAEYASYRRALCLLDPYGLHLNWEVVHKAAQMKSIEIFLNFPLLDMNRNVLWRNPEGVNPQQVMRMNAFWGDDSWHQIAYDTTGNLFGFEMKTANVAVVAAYRDRLRNVAGFGYVPDPIPMRNSRGGVIYLLFFASHKPVAANIVADIFDKYRNRGVQ